MNFAQPALAGAAVLAAAMPVLLHLLLRRPRMTDWPSTMLLRRAIERLRRRRRLDAWILLAMRALGIALVGVAMAGPFLGSIDTARGARELWIVLDDGATSAEALPDGGSALDALVAQADRELGELASGDRAALVLCGRPASVSVSVTGDVSRVRDGLRKVRPRAVAGDLQAGLELAIPETLDSSREVLLMSSLRSGSVPEDGSLPPAWRERSERVRWRSARPIVERRENRWIVSSESVRMVDASTGESTIRVELERSAGGATSDEVQVRSVDGVSLALQEVGWSAGATRSTSTIPLRSVRDRALVVQSRSDAQPLDDEIPMVLGETGSPRVLVITRRSSREDIENLPASEWITQALVSSGVAVREADPSNVALRPPTEGEQVIVCRPDLMDATGWKSVAGCLHEGGMVTVMAVDTDAQRWTADAARALGVSMSVLPGEPLPSARLAPRQPRGPLFAMLGAELDALSEPVTIQRRWRIASDTGEAALLFDDGSPALVGVRPGDGAGVLLSLAFPPELSCTDLPLRPMMVPLFQEMVRAGRSLSSSSGGMRSGEVASLGSAAAGGLLRSMDPARATRIEIDADGRTTMPVPFPGLWMIERRDGQSRPVAIRVDPKAASIEPVPADRIEAWRSSIGRWRWIDEVEPGDAGTSASESPWTAPLLTLALTLLVSESLWSRRSSPRRGAVAS